MGHQISTHPHEPNSLFVSCLKREWVEQYALVDTKRTCKNGWANHEQRNNRQPHRKREMHAHHEVQDAAARLIIPNQKPESSGKPSVRGTFPLVLCAKGWLN
jgi:hypothetical protein